jgi:glyoxylase-like metal-dependent hydrolase (beta-lactamase superfamily II)
MQSRLVQWMWCAALVPVIPTTSSAADAAVDATEVAAGIHLLRGAFVPGQQPDGNSVLLRAPDGLIVVDSGRHAAHTQRILDFAADAKQPIVAVVNTHWHLDHISGNARLRAAHPDLRVHASDALDAALAGFLATGRRQMQQMLDTSTDEAEKARLRDEIARVDSGPALKPDVVIDAPATRALAGKPLRWGFERASVTAGDVWLFDPATRVLISGDLVTLPAPFLDTACPARWRATLERLDQVEFDILLPGHGAPMTHADFGRYRDAFGSLLDCAATPVGAATCVDGWMRDAQPLLAGHPEGLARDLVDYYVQHRLRGDAATRDCPAG